MRFSCNSATMSTMRWVVLSLIVSSANGFKIETSTGTVKYSSFQAFPASSSSSFPRSKFDFQSTESYKDASTIAGYPKVPPPNAYEAGGHEDDLLPPYETSSFHDQINQTFRRSIEDGAVDPKTGYPLVAQPAWKNAGGNEEILELPLEDSRNSADQEAVDPKTGYPLLAQPGWKDAGGNEDILELPFEDSGEKVTGEEKEQVDPKTGYPLVAQISWQDAGGNGDILELPLEDSNDEEKVDPKTGYPLVAQIHWSDAGGNGEILEPPLEDSNDMPDGKVDPKTGYPLVAQISWQDAGGNGDILDLPLEDPADKAVGQEEEKVDPKTGYPLVAQPSWQDAGGNGDILDLPLEDPTDKPVKQLDLKISKPVTGNAGTKEEPEIPFQESTGNFVSQFQSRSGEVSDLTQELLPPLEDEPKSTLPFINSVTTSSTVLSRGFQQTSTAPTVVIGGNQNQRKNTFGSQQFNFNREDRPVESSYTYTGPDNVVVTVTRFLNTDNLEKRSYPGNRLVSQFGFGLNGLNQRGNSQNDFGAFSQGQTPIPYNFQSDIPKAFTIQNNTPQPNGVTKQFQFQQTRLQPSAFPPTIDIFQSYSGFKTRQFK